MRSHENVLRFLCAEEWSEGGGVLGGPEYWLVTEYHPRGSLSDFLKVIITRPLFVSRIRDPFLSFRQPPFEPSLSIRSFLFGKVTF